VKDDEVGWLTVPPMQLNGDGDLLIACQRSFNRSWSDNAYLTAPVRIGHSTDILQTRTHPYAVVQKMSSPGCTQHV